MAEVVTADSRSLNTLRMKFLPASLNLEDRTRFLERRMLDISRLDLLMLLRTTYSQLLCYRAT